ncbi:extracellular solute-binding protein [Paenibacillus koleovorans]|uniref:extracellular solute-binding protein n=1 Tax=Paenibacillus koleovorans TaxID=121608 RepID=UPI001FEB2D81|nr:extracellular solute-binding protein [Paenibacillus koleovorans]
MKKWVSAVMSATLTVGLLAGCGAKEEKSPDAGTSASTTPAAVKKQTYSMLVESHPSWPYSKDWPVWKMIEEKTGATFNVQVPSGKIEDALSLTIASGEMPDVMYTLNKQLADKYGMQGALVNILDYVDKMPNFKKWLTKYPDEAQNSLAADGKMYIFPNEGISETNRNIWMYRQDVFQQNNLQVPKNYDELYTVLKKLKELYPNSYPFAFRFGNALQIMRNMSTNFMTNEDFYYDFDKKEWKYGPIDDNYKTLVTWMNKFYKEGLMPPDWLTTDVKQWQDLVSTNRTFVTIDYIGRIDNFNVPLRKDNPKFNMAFMAPPIGLANAPQKNPFTHFKISGMMVSSTSKKVDDLMKVMDFYYTEEGRTLLSWGKENETYKVENGKKKFIESYIDVGDLRKKTGLSTNAAFTWFDYDAHLSLATPELQQAYVDARKYDAKLDPEPPMTEKEMEVMTTTYAAIVKHREQNVSKFILGERSLTEWDKYVDEQKKLGIDKVLDVHKQAYDRVLNKK